MAISQSGFPLAWTARVVVVEQDEEVCSQLASLLFREGYQAHFAHSAAEAKQLVESLQPEVVLANYDLPDSSSLTLCQEWRQHEALPEVPVILTARERDPETVRRGFEAGAVGFLYKPYVPEELLGQLRNVVGIRRALAARDRNYLRLSQDVETAARYIRQLLPDPMPTTRGVSATWRFEPSEKLGGDGFAYDWIDDDHFAVTLFDASGHGIGASFLVVTMLNMLRSSKLRRTVDLRDPAAVLTSLNGTFQTTKHDGMFLTQWVGVYHRSTRTLRYASAGHIPAVLSEVAEPGGLRTLHDLGADSVFLGGLPDYQYESQSVQVSPRARLYVLSDGLLEVQNPRNEWLDENQIREVFARPVREHESALDDVLEIARDWRSAALEDDACIVQVEFE